ncbi:thiamine ABC transporter ATP-binding protein [Loktanella sp. D2R18]|uniref:thiamine ABC transporter ATP-binding protein n=1 Tax=Rhodobacterales TaxID=204455 RepID=UPI000DEB5FAA|nr:MULTISPECIES: ATP-binding cassette domain-containing protein [Rhodobacterales]MDO6590500.1 ATP-binding cassette domain-containing protein [Yoonia sp. 1_MG-2023]RBW41218.1 thiamine ABC transporter ATP-binding protein [Loktanella sp. D2R18]
MLICEDLELRYDDFSLRADLRFPTGAITALIGPSGAGKSTLLAAIAGFLAPASGRVSWAGADITTLSPADRPISMLFQDNNLFPHLTIAQNVGLGLRAGLRLSASQMSQVEAVLESVGLEGMGTRKPAALSGGQQSRAALARVLLADRPLVLLDEPFAALGPSLKAEMLDLVKQRLADQGRTVIMVTHDPHDAKRIADAVAVVEDGVVTDPAPTAGLFDNPPPVLAAYLGM